MLEIKPVADLGILAGIQMSFNVSRKCTDTYRGITRIYSGSEFYKFYMGTGFLKSDAGLVLGLQYTFIDKITVGARYHLGLLNSWISRTIYSGRSLYNWDVTEKGCRTNVIQIGLGFSF